MSNLKSIGAQLANCAYNLAQDEKIPKPWRETLNRLRKEWDAALSDPVASAAPSGELPPLPEGSAWATPLRYGSKIGFPKPPRPADWDDDEQRWFCDPYFTADQMQAYARAAIAHQPPKEALTLGKLNELAAKHIKDIAGYERPIEPMGEDHEFIIMCRAIEAASAPNKQLVAALRDIAKLESAEETRSIARDALASAGLSGAEGE